MKKFDLHWTKTLSSVIIWNLKNKKKKSFFFFFLKMSRFFFMHFDAPRLMAKYDVGIKEKVRKRINCICLHLWLWYSNKTTLVKIWICERLICGVLSSYQAYIEKKWKILACVLATRTVTELRDVPDIRPFLECGIRPDIYN